MYFFSKKWKNIKNWHTVKVFIIRELCVFCGLGLTIELIRLNFNHQKFNEKNNFIY